MNRILFLTLFLALTTGCTPQKIEPKVNLNDPAEIGRLITVKFDEFKKTTSYIAPEGNNEPTATYRNSAYLRAVKSNSKLIVLQVVLHDIYAGEWRFYDNIYDSNGSRLDVTLIDRDVLSCSSSICTHSEVVGANIDLEYLELHRDKGIRVKLSGRTRSQVFQLSPAYIQAFILKINDRPS